MSKRRRRFGWQKGGPRKEIERKTMVWVAKTTVQKGDVKV